MQNLTVIEQKDGSLFTFYDNNLGTILRTFSGFEFASVINSIDDVAGVYGSVYVNSKQGTRDFSIEGDLVSDDVYTLRRTLLNALRQTGVIKLIKFTTYDGLMLQCEAEVVKVLNPYTHDLHTYLIEFLAPDWRFYSQSLKSYNLSQTFVKGGAAIPLTVPVPLTKWTDPEVIVNGLIVNDGNEVTDPIFTLTGPGDYFTITNLTTGKTMVLDYTLIGGDEVVIDIKNRTVILNGITNLYKYISGDFWSIIPGDNAIGFYVSTGLTIDTNLNILFRDAYNGV